MTKEKSSRELKRSQRSKQVRAKKAKPEVQVMPEVYCGGGCHVES